MEALTHSLNEQSACSLAARSARRLPRWNYDTMYSIRFLPCPPENVSFHFAHVLLKEPSHFIPPKYLMGLFPTSTHLLLVCHSPLVFSPSSFPPSRSAPAPLPDCFQSFLKEEALDFFCSQCHKQISRLEDLSTRLNFLEMTR